ncbi:MAG: OmpA family protein [Acidobacteria bacterium]|nr:OmpA family protein [Acidobacteriota bacterium]
MKLIRVFLTVIFGLGAVLSAGAQVTGVSQFKDVRPAADYYADLKSLVERYSVVGDDLKLAADDTVPKPADAKAEFFYRPQTRLTNRQFAVLLARCYERLNDLMNAAILSTTEDEKQKEALGEKLFALFNHTSVNRLNVTTVSGVRGLDSSFEEYDALVTLIERVGVGGDFLNADKSYTPTRQLSEKEVSEILGNLLGLPPACRAGGCRIGNLALNYGNKTVDRGRFARILNQYLDAMTAKINETAANFRRPETGGSDPAYRDEAVRIVAEASDLTVNFKTASAELAPESLAIIKQQAEMLQKLRPTTVVEVGVHSDNVGSATSNLALTERRAEAVRAELIRLGVNPDRIVAKGYGAAQSKTANETAEGRTINRRVEFSILKL